MKLSKRNFLKASGASIATALVGAQSLASGSNKHSNKLANISGNITEDITKNVKPISSKERLARVAKAQSIMRENNIAAMILEPGASMDYFTGIQWWRSERMTAVVIPREGEIAVVCPFFEEPSIRESMSIGNDVRVWQEHESPFELVAQVLKEKSLNNGNLAFERSVRFFAVEGIMAALPMMTHQDAIAITRGCRMIKSQHELQLMHKANEITLTAYGHVYKQLELGMSQSTVKNLMQSAQSKLGGSDIWNMALFNEASAFPHGTHQKQTIRYDSIVLLDCGCSVHGYQSDISRTFVYGEANKKQKKIWNTVRKGQQIAFEKAQIGSEAGKVDDAVRQYYEKLGLGPHYKLPGLSHRTGHGIGMEGHEDVNFVHNEKETLKSGMCFSDEPGIYLPGEFGVRLEDCIYMTDKDAQWFTKPPSSLDDPLGRVVPLTLT